MTGATIALVLLSALAHASWNFLIKRADDAEVFTWWMAVSINIVLFPLGVVLFWINPPDSMGWTFIAATWILHLVYFLTLSRAYRDGDLSLVYPVARGTGLLLIPLSDVPHRRSRRRRNSNGRLHAVLGGQVPLDGV